VLVIKRIHVRYHLTLRPEQRETAERVHGLHQNHCPVARTLRGSVEITTALEPEVEA
jgi:organic hydroperoxide reductase OsmC/OhrA